jgi:hypothetical protein
VTYLISLLALAAVIFLAKPIQQIVNTAASLLTNLLHACDEGLEKTFAGLSGWLRRDGVPEALSVITYDSVAGAVGLACWADYTVLAKSLALIWPWPDSAALLAGALVAMVGLLAYAAHSSKNVLSRGVVTLMLAGLISVQGILAYIRAVEVQTAQAVMEMPQLERTGQVIFGAPATPSGQSVSLQPGNSAAAAPSGPDLLSILAAVVAVLLSLAQAYGCSKLVSGAGGTALSWTLFFPILSLNWLILGPTHLLRRGDVPRAIGDMINAVLESTGQVRRLFLESTGQVRRLALSLAEQLRPSNVKRRSQERHANRMQAALHDIRVQTAQQAIHQIATHFIGILSDRLAAPSSTAEQRQENADAMDHAIREYRRLTDEIARDIPASVSAPAREAALTETSKP